MRVFYSELSANPSLYSFGYSVYGELEPGDDLGTYYEQGFLPFVGTETQQGKYVYMGRGTRLLVPEFAERHYHARVRRKASTLGTIRMILHTLDSFPITDIFIQFVLRYFRFRFGADAMPEARLRMMLRSGFVTHIREFSCQGKPVAYILEVHGKDFVHTWYHAYAHELEGTHAGVLLYLDLIKDLQTKGTKYLYLGITCGRWMEYKTNFQPLEYWDGCMWVHDPKSTKLKQLLKADSTRLLTGTDPWRDAHVPFYRAAYPYTGLRFEFRIIELVFVGLPRTAKLVLIVFSLLVLVLVGSVLHLW
jgi:hypothetical protein